MRAHEGEADILTATVESRFPPYTVSRGWRRYVRFREIRCTQLRAEMGAELTGDGRKRNGSFWRPTEQKQTFAPEVRTR
jgi:hypothetical protein